MHEIINHQTAMLNLLIQSYNIIFLNLQLKSFPVIYSLSRFELKTGLLQLIQNICIFQVKPRLKADDYITTSKTTNDEETEMDTCPLCTSNRLFKVFFPRTINEWNELPSGRSLLGRLSCLGLGSTLICKRVQGLAFPIETAPVAGSFTPFKLFNVFLLVLALTATSVCMQFSFAE